MSHPFGGSMPPRDRHVPLARPAPALLRETRPAPTRFLTVAEIALQLRVSKMTVYRLVHAGELASVRVGRSFRVPEKSLEDYLTDGGLG